MARQSYTCTGCKPVDTSIIEAFMVLVHFTEGAQAAEDSRNSAELGREAAETERTRVFNADHTRANDDHALAASDHGTASEDHSTASSDHTRANNDHDTAVLDHSNASDDHTRAGSDHGLAADDHATAGADHTLAASDHVTAADDHGIASGDHTTASSDHGIAAGDHTTATTDHGTAGDDHTLAAADHATAAEDHGVAVADHTASETATTRANDAAAAAEHMVDIKQGPQGNTGSSVDYPYELVNNCTTDDTTKGLAASQGVALKEDIAHLNYEFLNMDIASFATTAQGFYINATSNVWKTSNSTKCFFVNILPGHRYRVTAGSQTARIAILTSTSHTTDAAPSYATGETAMRYVAAGKTYEFVAPSDAKFFYANALLSSTDITPASLYDLIPKDEYQRDLEIGQPYVIFKGFAGNGQSVDARPASSTFGKFIRVSSDTNWGVTGFFNVENAVGVKFYTNKVSTSNSIYGVTGAVFYDANYTPITTGVWTPEQGSASASGFVVIGVPAGAKYVRFSIYGNQLEGKRDYFFTWTRAVDEPYFNWMSYQGERIELDPQRGFSLTTIGTGAGSNLQSGDVYGKYLFTVTEYVSKIFLYDLESRTLIYTLTTGIAQETTCHANQSSFGTLKYDADDMFPVLYISHARNIDGRAPIDVYRIIPTLTDDEITSFTVTRVQRILLPTMTVENGLGYVNVAIDTENNAMWAYSRYSVEGASTSGKATFTRFKIPSLSSSEVSLTDADIKDYFREYWLIANNQGAFIHRNKMYMMQGLGSSSDHNKLHVIDLYYKRCRVTYVDLYQYQAFEPEGVFYYDGHICCVSSSGQVRKMDL